VDGAQMRQDVNGLWQLDGSAPTSAGSSDPDPFYGSGEA
jgi:hypothetical protein